MKELMKETEEKMKKSNARLAHEFTTIRAGRANPAVLDKVQVDYYGVPTPIQQMAAVSVSEALNSGNSAVGCYFSEGN